MTTNGSNLQNLVSAMLAAMFLTVGGASRAQDVEIFGGINPANAATQMS